MHEMSYRVDSLAALRALQTATVIHLMDLGLNRELALMLYRGIPVTETIGWFFLPNLLAFVLYWGTRPRWEIVSVIYGIILSVSMIVIAFSLNWTGFTSLMMALGMLQAGLLVRYLYIISTQKDSE